MKIYDYIKSSTWGVLESDIPPDEKVKKIIFTFSVVCAATAIQPIPFADIFILTPMQAYMGTLIARVRGYNFTMQQIYKEIIGVMALGFLAQQTAIGLYKFIPFWGVVTTIPLVFILTYTIGSVMNYYFESKTAGKKVTKEDLKNFFNQAKKDAQKKYSKAEIKKRVKEEQENIKNYKKKVQSFSVDNIDELMTMTVMGKIRNNEVLSSPEEFMVLDALIRSTDKVTDLPSAVNYVKEMSERGQESLLGMSNNLKGILHEIEFVYNENSDGDQIFAILPESTNQPGFDVYLLNSETGSSEWVQLKTTMNTQHVTDWIAKYPGNEDSIIVNEEIAQKLGLQSSGMKDSDLTFRTEDVVNKMIEHESTLSEIISATVPLSVISIAFVIYQLNKKYKSNEITKDQFISMSTKMSGLKVSKIILILSLLATPVLGQIVAVVLISQLILGAAGIFKVTKEQLFLPNPIKGTE